MSGNGTYLYDADDGVGGDRHTCCAGQWCVVVHCSDNTARTMVACNRQRDRQTSLCGGTPFKGGVRSSPPKSEQASSFEGDGAEGGM